jgi:hypothetical protein
LNDFRYDLVRVTILTFALAFSSPQAILLLAVLNVLVAGHIAFFFLDGMDQLSLGHLGVILDPHLPSFGLNVFYNHNEPPGFVFFLPILV